MTHTARLKLLLASILLCAFLAAGAATAGVLCARGVLRVPVVDRSEVWWFAYHKTPESHFRDGYAALLAMLAVGIFFALRLRWLFARTASPQDYFFLFFLCSLSLEVFRVAALILADGPALALMLLSRAVYAGRLFGTLCLFGASLFSLDIRYSRLGTLLGIAALVALMFAYTVPLDSSVFLANGLHRLGDERGAALVFFAMYAFIVVNPLVMALREQTAEPLASAGAFALALGGRELLLFSASVPSASAGLAMLVAGCILFVARSERVSTQL